MPIKNYTSGVPVEKTILCLICRDEGMYFKWHFPLIGGNSVRCKIAQFCDCLVGQACKKGWLKINELQIIKAQAK
jgi:hypothetical protein